VRIADWPLQIVGELTIMVIAPPIVTVETAVLEQPVVVPVTVYDVVEAGETVIGFVIAPVFQEYVAPPIAVKVAVCPEQIVGEFTVITGMGFTLTVETAVLEQPEVIPVTV
jgi:hypothetical protein